MPRFRGQARRFAPILATAAVVLAIGCGREKPRLESISMDATEARIPKGLTARLEVTGHWSDGSLRDASASARWSTSAAGVASVDAGGLVSAVEIGSAVITADVEGHTATASVAVLPPIPVSIAVDPAAASVPKGRSRLFTALGRRLSDGTVVALSSPVTWTSALASVAAVDANGLASSVGPGESAIVASDGELSGQGILTVTPPIVASLSISPSSGRMVRGLSFAFRVIGTLTDGTTADVTSTASWTSSDDNIATVSAGQATGHQGGEAVVRATKDEGTASAPLTVVATRVAFVTRAMGIGDLSSWPESGGRAGLDGADVVCQAAATAAGLPGTFRAWLSDHFDDAYCRVHGLRGKLASNCGSASLPSDAGPWVRTDAYPFGPVIGSLLEGVVFAPLRFDERGRRQPDMLPSRTATGMDGALDPYSDPPCGNWSGAQDPAEMVRCGETELGSVGWSSLWTYECHWATAMICLEIGTGAGPPLPPLDTGKRVFLTSQMGSGDLGAWPGSGGATGIAAGDAICRARAAAAGLASPERFKAWLSDATTNAIERLSSDGPWVRLDGTLVARKRAVLASGETFSAISLTETGEYRGNNFVWTGTDANGKAAANHCNGWTDPDFSTLGLGGHPASAGTQWTAYSLGTCPAKGGLYCFED